MTIAENVKRLRKSHDLTQAEFGKIAGVSFQAVSAWESGIKTPKMGAVEKLANHFGIAKSEVLFGEAPAVAPARQRLRDIANTCTDAEAERLVAILDAVLGKETP